MEYYAGSTKIGEAFALARDGSVQVRGRLRIAAPILYAQLAMGRLCAEFRARYPEVRNNFV